MSPKGTFWNARKAVISIVVSLVLAIVTLAVWHIASVHYRTAQLDFEPFPATTLSNHPETVGIAGLANVSFVSRSGNKILGWYTPASNRAAIILAHGTNADRTALLPELRFLTAAGFGVLSIDWPGDGGSEGEIHWDQHERNALTAAVDWLLTRDDIDAARIGAFGFSMGAYVTAQVASYDQRISAIALAAAPTDFAEYTLWDNRRYGWLSQFPAMQAVRAAKMPLNELRAIDVVKKISPRPLLVIGGDVDGTVPEWMTRKLFAAAGQPKSLWIVHGAGHGNYSITAPDAYKAQLLEFFSRSLTPLNAPE
jgi:uncharacterized protein